MAGGTFASSKPTPVLHDVLRKRAPLAVGDSVSKAPAMDARSVQGGGASQLSRDFSTLRVYPDAIVLANRRFSNSTATDSGIPSGADDAPAEPVPATEIQNLGMRREVTLQPVFIRSSPTDTPTGATWPAGLQQCQNIWSKVGIVLNPTAPITVTDATKKTYPDDETQWGAVSTLWRWHSGGNEVGVIFVDNDVSWAGGGRTNSPGGPVVVSDRPGTSDTLIAHEFGHALGLLDARQGTRYPDTDTIMEATGARTKSHSTRNTYHNYKLIKWPDGNGKQVFMWPDR